MNIIRILSAALICGFTLHSETVRITYPSDGSDFGRDTVVRIKVTPEALTTEIQAMQFFANGELVYTSFGPSFTGLWNTSTAVTNRDGIGTATIVAKATLSDGRELTSDPTHIETRFDPPPWPVVNLTMPTNNAMFAAGQSFTIEGQIMASIRQSSPITLQVLDGTNTVAELDQKEDTVEGFMLGPFTWPEGYHDIKVRYLGENGGLLRVNACHIRVVNCGITGVQKAGAGQVQFWGVSTILNRETMLQSSSNLIIWNNTKAFYPTTNAFLISEAFDSNQPLVFYRLLIP